MYRSAVCDLTETPVASLVLPDRFLTGEPTVWRILEPVPYLLGYALQLALVREFIAKSHPPILILLEHEPVATLGRSSPLPSEGNIDLPVYRTHRGGAITFHGPGQLVGYPIIHLRENRLGVLTYVNLLEHTLYQVVKRFSAPAQLLPRKRGVFTPRGKLLSLGIAVKRGVSWHGFALNLEDQSSLFTLPPCNLPGMVPDHLSRYTSAPFGEIEEAIASDLFCALGYPNPSRVVISLSNLFVSPCLTLPGSG